MPPQPTRRAATHLSLSPLTNSDLLQAWKGPTPARQTKALQGWREKLSELPQAFKGGS